MPDQKPYFWWEGRDLYEFFATVGRCGYDNVRIEMHETAGPEGRQAWLDVIDKETGELMGHYNYSHVCPPDCDGG